MLNHLSTRRCCRSTPGLASCTSLLPLPPALPSSALIVVLTRRCQNTSDTDDCLPSLQPAPRDLSPHLWSTPTPFSPIPPSGFHCPLCPPSPRWPAHPPIRSLALSSIPVRWDTSHTAQTTPLPRSRPQRSLLSISTRLPFNPTLSTTSADYDANCSNYDTADARLNIVIFFFGSFLANFGCMRREGIVFGACNVLRAKHYGNPACPY